MSDLDWRGRISIRKHEDGWWRVKRIRLGRAFTIHITSDFDGVLTYIKSRGDY